MTRPTPAARSGSSPAARACTARTCCARSPTQSREIADALDAAERDAGAGRRGSRCSPTPTRSAGRMLDANSDDRLHGRHRLDAHVQPRRRCGSPGSTRCSKPLLHLHTQANVELPWDSIDLDFMNLNQAAHGDREFGYIQTRLGIPRTTVAGHVSEPGRSAPGSARGRGRRGLGRDRTTSAGPVRRQHAQRRRHRGRQDRGRDRGSASRSTPRPSTTWSTRSTRCADAEVDRVVDEYERRYDVAAELRRAGTVTSRCATRAGRSWRCAASSTDGGFRRSRPTSRTSVPCASCPASPSNG